MKQVPFGKTGAIVSEMCLGTMMFGDRCDENQSNCIVSAALDKGVTFIDTASAYCKGQTEEILGRILRGWRQRVFLATKVHEGLDYASITASINKSLKRLQTDFVDLYIIHWPQEGMQPAEIMRALNDVVRSGKTRFIGCSNYPAWLFAYSNAIARANGWPEFTSNQVPYNPIERGIEVEILPQAVAENIAITVYRPLAMGLLSGKYRPGGPIPSDARGTSDERLVHWLEKYGSGVSFFLNFAEIKKIPPVSLGIAWVRSSAAACYPIVGISRISQLGEIIKSFDFVLSPEERSKISNAFGAEVKEEAGGKFPGLRREFLFTQPP